MTKRDQLKQLKAAGFWLERQGSRHELWTNGKIRISLSHGGKIVSEHTERSFKMLMRRARKELEQIHAAQTLPA